MKKFIFFSLALFALNASAKVNWSECNKLYDGIYKNTKSSDKNWLNRAISQATAAISTGAPSSATSYVSSTGPCKAFAYRQAEQYRYIAECGDAIEKQGAQGRGEYVDTLAHLYGCETRSETFAQALRAHHTSIFAGANTYEIMMGIQEVVDKDPKLATICRIND